MVDPNPNSYKPLDSGAQNFNWDKMGDPEGFIGSGVGILASGEANFADFSQKKEYVSGINSVHPHPASDSDPASLLGLGVDPVQFFNESGVYKTYPANSGTIEKVTDDGQPPTGINNSIAAPLGLRTPHSLERNWIKTSTGASHFGASFLQTVHQGTWEQLTGDGSLVTHDAVKDKGISDFTVFNPFLFYYPPPPPPPAPIGVSLDPTPRYVQMNYAATNGFVNYARMPRFDIYSSKYRAGFDLNIFNRVDASGYPQELVFTRIKKGEEVVMSGAFAWDNAPAGHQPVDASGDPVYVINPSSIPPTNFKGIPEPSETEEGEEITHEEPITEGTGRGDGGYIDDTINASVVPRQCGSPFTSVVAGERACGLVKRFSTATLEHEELFGKRGYLVDEIESSDQVKKYTESRYAVEVNPAMGGQVSIDAWNEYLPWGDFEGSSTLYLNRVRIVRIRRYLMNVAGLLVLDEIYEGPDYYNYPRSMINKGQANPATSIGGSLFSIVAGGQTYGYDDHGTSRIVRGPFGTVETGDGYCYSGVEGHFLEQTGKKTVVSHSFTFNVVPQHYAQLEYDVDFVYRDKLSRLNRGSTLAGGNRRYPLHHEYPDDWPDNKKEVECIVKRTFIVTDPSSPTKAPYPQSI